MGYKDLQKELLRRVNLHQAFQDPKQKEDFKKKEDSVFDRVDQHQANLQNKLDVYAEQFKNAHEQVDHKTFTENWLYEQSGQGIQLEGVIQNPSPLWLYVQSGQGIQLEGVIQNPNFDDFTGVFDIMPMSAYIASKMIVDKDDFMGIWHPGTNTGGEQLGTYQGVEQRSKETDEKSLQHMRERESLHAEQKQQGEKEAKEAYKKGAKPSKEAIVNETASWKYTDTWSVAKFNPMRWSSDSPVQTAIDELSKLNAVDAKRPLEIELKARHVRRQFNGSADALHYLKCLLPSTAAPAVTSSCCGSSGPPVSSPQGERCSVHGQFNGFRQAEEAYSR